MNTDENIFIKILATKSINMLKGLYTMIEGAYHLNANMT